MGVDVNWTEIDPDLGTAPDAEIARRHGLTKFRIRDRRQKLGIPSWKLAQAARRRSRIYHVVRLLGHATPEAVARAVPDIPYVTVCKILIELWDKDQIRKEGKEWAA